MHDTHLGFHAPPRVNQPLMVTQPKGFLHTKELGDGGKLEVFEEGEAKDTTEFQKYMGKFEAYPYVYHKWSEDMKDDAFLRGLGWEKKQIFKKELENIWAQNSSTPKEFWYMIVQDGGNKEVGLYQDYEVFTSIRDQNYQKGARNRGARDWSLKAVWFDNLKAAKNYVQMARDEEGQHFGWPKQIPVIWKKGPLGQSDIDEVPGFAEEGEEEEEEWASDGSLFIKFTHSHI